MIALPCVGMLMDLGVAVELFLSHQPAEKYYPAANKWQWTTFTQGYESIFAREHSDLHTLTFKKAGRV